MDWFTPELVVQMAIAEAEKKRAAGKLIAMARDYDFNADEEAVTIYSIFNLYKDFLMDKDHITLMYQLRDKYPDHFI